MTLKVIGAGFGRTGTLSLKLALESLGIGRCYHMIELFAIPGAAELWERAADGENMSWDRVFEGFSATVDWPSTGFYEDLARYYPRAKIILTRRDPDAWFESTQKTIFKDIEKASADSNLPWARMVKKVILDAFDGRIHDRAHAIAVYNAHNRRVESVIPKERLLVFDIAEGWAPLCQFLSLPVPDAPFPRSNSTEEFAQRHADRARDLLNS